MNMDLNEFRQRWIDNSDQKAESSINDSRADGVDGFRRMVEQPIAWQPVRLRPKYVPEADSDIRSDRIRQAAVRALVVVLTFVAALIVMGVAFDYLPGYLATYVFDR